MTEQKKPEPGQWLVMNDRPNTKVFLVGKNAKGQWVIEWEGGDTSVDVTLDDWHHEPSCDSWTWQPPDWVTQDRVPARPGIDQIRWSSWDPDQDWLNARQYCLETKFKHGDTDPKDGLTLSVRCLRKDLPPVQEVWPKYYGAVLDSPCYYRFDSPTLGNCYGFDGSITRLDQFDCQEIPANKKVWKQLTESEALSRIVKPAEPQPTEDPDEWVIITDMSHVCRSGSDEITACGQNQGWCGGGIWKGKTLAEWKAGKTYPEKFLFRCRRRDLPVKPEPQPYPLRIYATADDVLYIDTHPRQTTHHEVDFGVPVVITLKEVGE